MKTPLQYINANPKRPGESPQGYAKRVLEVAQPQWVTTIFDRAAHLVEKESNNREAAKQKECVDACTNVLIEIQAEKELVLNLLTIG